jgi:hypothetical protein
MKLEDSWLVSAGELLVTWGKLHIPRVSPVLSGEQRAGKALWLIRLYVIDSPWLRYSDGSVNWITSKVPTKL